MRSYSRNVFYMEKECSQLAGSLRHPEAICNRQAQPPPSPSSSSASSGESSRRASLGSGRQPTRHNTGRFAGRVTSRASGGVGSGRVESSQGRATTRPVRFENLLNGPNPIESDSTRKMSINLLTQPAGRVITRERPRHNTPQNQRQSSYTSRSRRDKHFSV